MQRNHIYANGGLGLDLEPFGITVNDALDVDLGANDLQNFPELTTAKSANGVLTVDGVLNSEGGTAYAIELFASTACDASNHGEAERYIGSFPVTTAVDGTATFVTPLSVAVPAGEFVTATATDPTGNTSEFSACSLVTS